LKILTANIAHGLKFGEFSIVGEDALQSLAQELKADVVCLQEVDFIKERSSMLDQIEILRIYGGFEFAYFFPALVGEPGDREVFRIPTSSEVKTPPENSYGIGILSRFPINDVQTMQLSGSRLSLPMPFLVDGKNRWRMIPDEPRIAARVTVESPQGEIDIVTTHLSFIPSRAISQLLALRHLVRTKPTIFAGDFNLAPGITKTLTQLNHAVLSPTYPKLQPRAQLDHILISNTLTSIDSGALELPISDHLALFAEVSKK
jgi:endonuclease/exonuclease/phosphatase family metal-dependent hydrolase